MKAEILDKIAALLTAAFGLVAALAWNGAIRAIFQEVFGNDISDGEFLGGCAHDRNRFGMKEFV